ncbi:MAG: sensor histidine kinase, partial [Nocardioides sp.]
PFVAHTDRMRVSRRVLDDPDLLRRVAYAAGGGAAVISLVSTLTLGTGGYAALAAYAIPVSVLASLPSQPWRSTVLAAGAAFVAAFTNGDTVPLWLGVAALVFGSVAEDLRPVPWVGWAGGLLGSLVSLALSVATEGSPAFAALLGVVFGGSLGLLLRARLRTLELSGEAKTLRGRAAWLEQRTSLARELHDVVGHHVTAMVVQAEAGQMAEPGVALKNIGELGRKALGDLDALVVHLRDPDSPMSVSAPPRLLDIDELLAAPLRLQGVEVDIRIEAELGLGGAELLTVYRIAQEALTNVTRHAQATHTWVELSRADDRMRLRVSDDGVGPPDASRRGSGLLGIEERVAAHHGTWDLSQRPGGGTILDVSFPVGPR